MIKYPDQGNLEKEGVVYLELQVPERTLLWVETWWDEGKQADMTVNK